MGLQKDAHILFEGIPSGTVRYPLRMAGDSNTAFEVLTGGTGAVVAGGVILRTGWAGWRRTVGSRTALAKKLATLRVGMSNEYLTQTFGAPTFGRLTQLSGTNSPERRAVWSFRHALLACHVERGELFAFTIITTDRWFRPSLGPLSRGMFTGRLGEHTFEHLTDRMPDQISSQLGAATVDYAEQFYFGRPGSYADYVLSASGEGWPAPSPPGFTVDGGAYDHVATKVSAFRRANRANAVTISTTSNGGGLLFHTLLMDDIEAVALSLRDA